MDFSEVKGCDFMKKFSLLLPKLNIFTSLIYLLLFALIKSDIHIFSEPVIVIFAWTTPVVGAVILIFILSVIITAFKTKKIPNSFEYIISYLFTAVSLCLGCWLIYSFLDAWFMF